MATNPGLFNFQEIMDDFYGFEPEGEDDEGRALKRGFQSDMIKKAADQQFAMAQAAQAQVYGMDAMKLDAELTKDVTRTINQDAFEYGMKEMAQKYDFEARMAVDDASRELNKMGAAGDIQQNQTRLEGRENRLNLGEQGNQLVRQITEGGKQDRESIKLTGEQSLDQIGASGVEARAQIDAQRMADESILRTRGQEDRITQREGLMEAGTQERLTTQTRGTEDRSTLVTSGEQDRETIGKTGTEERLTIGTRGTEERSTIGTRGEEERKTIGKTAEEGRTTIDFTDQVDARKERRAEARSRALAAR